MRGIRIAACVLALLIPAVVTSSASAAIGTTDLNTLTPLDLAHTLIATGVSNATFTGAKVAGGTFTGGSQAVGFSGGVILSSGNVAGAIGPNTSTNTTTQNATAGDTDLDQLTPQGPGSTRDAAVLQFDFVPTTSTISFKYVFASEEYNEFVNSPYNDVFGFYINGVNCAVVGTPAVPVTINTINNGNPVGSTPSSHPELYRNNDFQSTPAPFNTQMDGLTTILTCTANVNPGVKNHAKLAIADVSDASWDSNVFLEGGSFGSGGPLPPPKLASSVNVAPVSGTVLVRLRGTKNFIPLSAAEQIPIGSELDATNGRVSLTTSAGGSKTQTADFYDGRFLIQQKKAKKPVTTLPLSAPLACGKRADATAAGKKKRKLWGSGKGRYQTKGKNASATVRGTIWLTQDTCAGTLVQVKRGVVDVLDFKRHKHVLVHAGHSYFAKR